jgi:hypothetical protein
MSKSLYVSRHLSNLRTNLRQLFKICIDQQSNYFISVCRKGIIGIESIDKHARGSSRAAAARGVLFLAQTQRC